MHVVSEGVHVPQRQVGFRLQGHLAPPAEHKVGLDAELTQRTQHPHAEHRARCAGDADDEPHL